MERQYTASRVCSSHQDSGKHREDDAGSALVGPIGYGAENLLGNARWSNPCTSRLSICSVDIAVSIAVIIEGSRPGERYQETQEIWFEALPACRGITFIETMYSNPELNSLNSKEGRPNVTVETHGFNRNVGYYRYLLWTTVAFCEATISLSCVRRTKRP